ncbi:hypothetical protein [Micromonospora cathayae]|uniref:Antibiotic biosynthesis monooxygenase n=1 Tax=Micromonospora cathayae TaxID=3028804 RepID=A0ABY7ZYI1_9ACTN|nr:hypothetical protein [Micromonospora sp. HUAS 3]WDZ87068.1 hypothetical protein PVK37_12010 [Micromonospora sp. HUAS 3]
MLIIAGTLHVEPAAREEYLAASRAVVAKAVAEVVAILDASRISTVEAP